LDEKNANAYPRAYSYAIAACQNKIYVIGGDNGTSHYLSTNEVYDPSTDTLETKAPMPTSRNHMDAIVLNAKIYVIGVLTSDRVSITTPVNEVYDPSTDSWTTKQPAPIAAKKYFSAVIDNKIYIMAGVNQNTSLNWVFNQVYDVENDQWSLAAPLPNATYYAAAIATTGVIAPKRIYVIGGGCTNTSNAVRVYNPPLDAWSSGAPMPTNRTVLPALW
jgi:N-acetylneuraminic acid mutarotase